MKNWIPPLCFLLITSVACSKDDKAGKEVIVANIANEENATEAKSDVDEEEMKASAVKHLE